MLFYRRFRHFCTSRYLNILTMPSYSTCMWQLDVSCSWTTMSTSSQVHYHHDSSPPWRLTIRARLRRKAKQEMDPFLGLIECHNRLFDNSETLRQENVQLRIAIERMRSGESGSNIGSPSTRRGTLGSTSSGAGNVDVMDNVSLQQRIIRLQEELTDIHRRKSENAQEVIDLRKQVQEKNEQLVAKDRRYEEAQSLIASLKNRLRQLEEENSDLQSKIQLLHDEWQTLQLAYSSIEDKYTRRTEEFDSLLQRWKTLNDIEVERMNAETDRERERLEQKVQSELEKAVRDKVIDPSGWQDIDKADLPQAFACYGVVVPTQARTKIDNAHEGEITCIRWSPGGSGLFASGGADRKVKIWSVSTVSGSAECRGTLTGSNAGVMGIDFDPEGELLIASSNDFASRVWSISDQRLRTTLTGHSGKVMAAKFFLQSTQVVSGSHDRTLRVWDLRSRATTRTIFAGSSCNDVVICSNNFVLSGHFDKKLRLWDMRSDGAVNELELSGRITSLDMSKSGLHVLTCSRDDVLRIIDLRTLKILSQFTAEGFHCCADYTRACFSPDASYVMAGSQDGILYVWNADKPVSSKQVVDEAGRPSPQPQLIERKLDEHGQPIIACSWHPLGSMLLSCDRNRKIILWSDM